MSYSSHWMLGKPLLLVDSPLPACFPTSIEKWTRRRRGRGVGRWGGGFPVVLVYDFTPPPPATQIIHTANKSIFTHHVIFEQDIHGTFIKLADKIWQICCLYAEDKSCSTNAGLYTDLLWCKDTVSYLIINSMKSFQRFILLQERFLLIEIMCFYAECH